jgi:hypothetical protein
VQKEDFAYLSEKDLTCEKTPSDVSAPRMISTNFIIGGGLKKCIPITCIMETSSSHVTDFKSLSGRKAPKTKGTIFGGKTYLNVIE